MPGPADSDEGPLISQAGAQLAPTKRNLIFTPALWLPLVWVSKDQFKVNSSFMQLLFSTTQCHVQKRFYKTW